MIYTKREYLQRYFGHSENLDKAIRFLEEHDLRTLPLGKTVIDGEEVFVNHFGYHTLEEEEASWEGHMEYADIHVLLSGKEKIGVSDCSELTETERDTESDFVGYKGDVNIWCPMDTTKVLVVFPEDVHMVKVTDKEPAEIDKLVFKVKLEKEY